jgi:ankyrin repeat protein
MQKLTKRERLLLLALIGLAVDAYFITREPAKKPRPEAAQQLLKLRGYEFGEQGFHAAARARDIMAVTAFLDGGININARSDADGRTALISAAARGDLQIVRLLLDRGADVNVKDNKEYTALHHAVEARYDDVSEVLLNHPKLDPNARGLNGVTTLMSYVWRERKDAVQRLLDRGADVNAQDYDGDSALHGAAQNGNIEIIDLLVVKGANLNLTNKVGGTPLMWAAVYGHEDAARRLLERGADPSLKDADGKTARDWAVVNGRKNLVALLQKDR